MLNSVLCATPLSRQPMKSARRACCRGGLTRVEFLCRYKGREGHCKRMNLLGGGTGITPLYQVMRVRWRGDRVGLGVEWSVVG